MAIPEKFKTIVRRIVRPHLHKAEIQSDFEVLGTSYGGWPLLDGSTPRGVLIYSFGIGEDISFDIAAIEKFGATVHAFDPTPRCKKWLDQQTLPANFVFHNVGLGGEAGEIEFFAPENDGHVSYSAAPAPASDPNLKIKAPVKRLETLISELGTACPDALKMDIEGFEYDVIDDVLAGPHRPHQWMIEFHHRMYGIETDRTRAAVEKLKAAGYQLFYVSEAGHEYGFVYNPASSA